MKSWPRVNTINLLWIFQNVFTFRIKLKRIGQICIKILYSFMGKWVSANENYFSINYIFFNSKCNSVSAKQWPKLQSILEMIGVVFLAFMAFSHFAARMYIYQLQISNGNGHMKL